MRCLSLIFKACHVSRCPYWLLELYCGSRHSRLDCSSLSIDACLAWLKTASHCGCPSQCCPTYFGFRPRQSTQTPIKDIHSCTQILSGSYVDSYRWPWIQRPMQMMNVQPEHSVLVPALSLSLSLSLCKYQCCCYYYTTVFQTNRTVAAWSETLCFGKVNHWAPD